MVYYVLGRGKQRILGLWRFGQILGFKVLGPGGRMLKVWGLMFRSGRSRGMTMYHNRALVEDCGVRMKCCMYICIRPFKVPQRPCVLSLPFPRHNEDSKGEKLSV